MNTPLGPNYFPFNKFCARPTEPNRDLRHPYSGQDPLREQRCFLYCNQDNFMLPSFSQQHSFLRNNQQFPFAPQKQQIRNFSSGSNNRDFPRNNFHNNYRNCNRTTNNRFGNFRNCNKTNPAQMFNEGMVATTLAATTTASATITSTGIRTANTSGPTITAQVEMNYYFPQNSGKMSNRGEHYKNFSASEVNNTKTVPDRNPSRSNLVSNQHPAPENTIINNIKNFVNGLINPHMRNFPGCNQNKYYNSQYRHNNFGKERKRNDSYSSTQSSSTSRDECSRRKPNSQSKTDMNSLLENRSYHPCNSVKTHRNFSSNNVKRNNFKKEFSRDDKIPLSTTDNKCSPSHYSNYVDPKMESEVVAIFSKDDFPELPMPKRQIYQDSQKNAKSQSAAVTNSLNGTSMGNVNSSLATTSANEINKKCSTNKRKKRRTRKGEDYCIEDSFVILPSNSASNPSKLGTSPTKSTCTKTPSAISSESSKMSNTNLEQNIDLSVNMGDVISFGSMTTSPISLNTSPSTTATALLSPVKAATSIFTKCLNSQPSESNDEINKENFVNFLKIGSPPTFSCNRQRQRQLSECSDDSFIICFTDNAADGIIQYSDTTDDEDETDTDDDDATDEEDEISENENDLIEHRTNSDDENDDMCLGESFSLENVKLTNRNRNKISYHNPKTKCDSTKGTRGEKTAVENQKKTISPSTITDDPNGLDQLDSGFEERKDRKVHFDLNPKIHIMHTWDYAYRAARKGEWEDFARDRLRFKHRVENLGNILNPILEQKHRDKIYNARFCDNLSSS